MDAYKLGFAAGAFGAIFILLLIRKLKGSPTVYDERQERIRGIGYRYAFYTTAFLLVFQIAFGQMGLLARFEAELQTFVIVLAGVLVYAVFCIMNDAYMGLNGNIKKYLILCSVVAAINLVSGIYVYKEDGITEKGLITLHTTANFLCVIMFTVIGIAGLVRMMENRKEKNDEES